ncbi:MAG: hypothetical protein KBG72_05850, partial [Agrobacterium sp.]|nr:hypothetical protein [Agrobacterium sp.]
QAGEQCAHAADKGGKRKCMEFRLDDHCDADWLLEKARDQMRRFVWRRQPASPKILYFMSIL